MSEKKEGVSRRSALKYIATGVICGAVAGVGGFYAGRATAPVKVKEVIKEVPVYKPTPPTKPTPPAAKKPVRIGFSMSLTGGMAAGGKASLLAMQMWKDDVNAKGGLWGERPVELVYYDDHSNPADVPAIYEKLITVDKVDYVVGPYATVPIAAAMPTIMEHKMAFITLFGLAVNQKFKYKYYFQIMPTGGPDPYVNWSKGFFWLADQANPRPKTVAITGEAHEYGQNAAIGARKNAEEFGFEIIYDKLVPPGTTDFTPVMRAIKAKNPDIVFIGTYAAATVGMIKAAKEVNLVPKMIGGGLVGWQFAPVKQTFGPTLNGVVNYDFWVPVPTLKFPGIDELLRRYQAKAPELGIDPLGYYLPPFAYAYVQILGQTIEATGTPDSLPTQEEVGEYMRKATFDTIVGKVKFGPLGEWEKSRVLQMQHRNVQSSDLEEFKKSDRYSVLYPPEYKWGEFIYPFPGWK